MSSRLIWLAAVFSCGALALGQGRGPEFPAVKLAAPPTIDGLINEEEWKDAAPKSFVFVDNQTTTPGRDPVEVRLAYDETAIYVAVRVKDDPRSLIATEYRQNVSLFSNDSIAFTLDPSGSYSGFNTFRVNPSGATTISLSGGRAAKAEWVGAFIAKGKVLDDGWSCEMAIPWKVLTLPSSGKKDIPIQVSWNDASDGRGRILAYADTDVRKLAHWTGVEVPDIKLPRTLNLLPYGYAGYDEQGKNRYLNAGLDFKTQIGRQGQMVGTINPDFRNIENSVLSLDFSYFERLAGEVRPFFLEGRQYLDNATGSILATQRIREFDAGVKAYGRLDSKSNYAVLATQDFGIQSNFALGYTRNPTPNSVVTAGLVRTARKGANNTAASFNVANQFGPYSVYGGGSYTEDERFGQGSTFEFGFNRSAKGSYFGAGFSQVSANFFPRLGFAPDQGYRSAFAYQSSQATHEKGPLKESGWGLNGGWSEKLNGDPYQLSGSADISATFRNDFSLGANYSQYRFFDSVDHTWSGTATFPANNPNRRVYVSYTEGDIARMAYTNVSMGATFRINRKLVTTWSSQWFEHYEKQRQTIATFNYDLGGYQNLAGRLIENEGSLNWHLTYRKAGTQGAEYFMILGDPNAKTFRRSLILKAVFPLTINY